MTRLFRLVRKVVTGKKFQDELKALTRVARELRTEVSKIDDVGLSYIVGETSEIIRIAPDPERLALYGVTLQQLAGKVKGANRSFNTGRVRDNGEAIVEVELLLQPGDSEAIRAKMEDFTERRESKQPLEMPSAGSPK